MEPRIAQIHELQLRDEVGLDWQGYATATVERITDDAVYLVRPYVHTSDVKTTSGVISYIGWENITLDRRDLMRQVTLIDRRPVR